jgi:hypothetical protein
MKELFENRFSIGLEPDGSFRIQSEADPIFLIICQTPEKAANILRAMVLGLPIPPGESSDTP